jgi:CRP-like cAMP-binding protein
MREGEDGEQAYVVADGELDVSVAERPVAVLRRGDLVGEIALLRSGKRTATVVARTETRLYELDSEAFFEIVGGNRAAADALDELVDTRLGEIAEIGGRMPP